MTQRFGNIFSWFEFLAARRRLRRERVLCVGTIRDGAKTLADDVARISKAFAKCRSLQWFVVESDSEDDTVAVLKELGQRHSNFRYLCLGRLQDDEALKGEGELRTRRLAFCRNRYLQEIRTHPAYKDVSLVVMVDLDGINVRVHERQLASCFRRKDWDVCAGTSDALYYDVWALRHPLWCGYDCWRQVRFFNQASSLSGAIYRRERVKRLILRLKQSFTGTRDWLEVDSAFGGFALYRRPILDYGAYHASPEGGGEICEHVPFHLALRKAGARIWINPELATTNHYESGNFGRGVTETISSDFFLHPVSQKKTHYPNLVLPAGTPSFDRKLPLSAPTAAASLPLRLVCMGVVHNGASTLRADVARISAACANFQDLHWFVVDAGSTDGTPAVLQELAARHPRFRTVRLDDATKRFAHEEERRAFCRNRCLHELRTHAEYAALDFVAVSELNGINTHLTRAGIASCFRYDDWDVCTANCDAPYYDIRSLRHPQWISADCRARQAFFQKRFGISDYWAYDMVEGQIMMRIQRSGPWIEVESAFGGFALYRRALLEQGAYSGVEADGTPCSEHVPLHLALRKTGARIWINPQLIASGYQPWVRYTMA